MKNPMKISLRGANHTLAFALNPAEIEVSDDERTAVFDTIKESIEFHAGENLTTYTWEGFFPGRARKNKAYITHPGVWKAPEECDETMRDWLDNGRVLRLIISGTRVRDDVRVASYSSRRTGGLGDIYYSLTLKEHRETDIDRRSKRKKNRKGDESKDEKKGADRTSRRAGDKTYTVKSGDTLSGISRRFLGTTARWREIYNLNKKVIGANPNNITPGMKLRIPER